MFNCLIVSVIYQDIFQEVEQRGFQIGFKRGFLVGFYRGFKQGQAKVIIIIITHRFGNIPEEIETKIRSLSLSQLDQFVDALLNFTSLDDLMNWFSKFQN
ncbi:MAG: DUF4351 domain-containing protein [Okeania sp. SIO3I5]|uniref:DUF4351 domain-containing protein n=1 Tax=Okeania sp. SIO3I5 TaxID=2607805 RepID=UPI0013BDACF8|nr:DUF4351 domain-containing protein [Okeania sp. SIO3I5]NEQ40462.1 DUF4351 domain-containing protein [Okeania sp. SIO3I5]